MTSSASLGGGGSSTMASQASDTSLSKGAPGNVQQTGVAAAQNAATAPRATAAGLAMAGVGAAIAGFL